MTFPELASLVGGDWRGGGTVVDDTNPADPAQVVATVSVADGPIASAAADAAQAAAARWSSASPGSRGDILHGAADLLDQRAEQIGRDLTREEGKTLAESIREVRLSARILRYYAGQALDPHGETYPSLQSGVLLFTRREPLGVVSVITPWNFPISIAAWKIAPALVFGNTVVWKPAELTPLTAVHLLTALRDAGLPDGVLNLVLGKGSQVGDVLATHPAIAAVSFTGSNPVGRLVERRATAAGKRVQLELGGKNPTVVLANAALGVAAEQIATSAFGGTGQKCTATSRVIVERPVLDEFVSLLTTVTKRWSAGDPLDPKTTMGPLASPDQLTTVLRYLRVAGEEGARTAAGGQHQDDPPAGGYFVAPTVLVDVEPHHTVAREEVFGPVVAVLVVDSYEEAVEQANDTPYGLSASVFTSDLGTALRFTEQSRAGIVKVNQATSGNEYHVPFGGTKDSGSGHRELGKAAREFFTDSKTVYIAHTLIEGGA